MRKSQEFRNLDDGQLKAEETQLRLQLFKLRNKDAMKQLDKPHEIKLTRRELACVITVMTERAKAANTLAGSNENKAQTKEDE